MINRDEKKINVTSSNEIKQPVVVTADEVKKLIASHSAAVKAMRSKTDAKQVEYTEWMFFIKQYMDPENNRPIKNPEQIMLSTKVYDPSIGTTRSRVSRHRGLPKKGVHNIKKTPISLLPTDGRMKTFHIDNKFYTTGLIYDIKLCSIANKWIFSRNMATNERWHIPGQPGYAYVLQNTSRYRSTTLENIRNTQNELMKEKELITWNEINAKTNRDSIKAIFTIQPYQENAYITDRINAIHKKYLVLTHLGRDLPIFCINSSVEASEYTPKQQASDIYYGLQRSQHDPKNSGYMGYIITKSLPFNLIFAPDSKLGEELGLILNTDEKYVKNTPSCAIFYYTMNEEITKAIDYIPPTGDLFNLTKTWVETYRNDLINHLDKDDFNRLCHYLNIPPLDLTKDMIEKIKTNQLPPFHASELFYLAIEKNEIDIAHLIFEKQMPFHMNIALFSNKNTIFHLLAESTNEKNLELLTTVCKHDKNAHTKNSKGKTPIEIALEAKNIEAFTIFITHHFNSCLMPSLFSSIPTLLIHNEIKLVDEILTRKGKQITSLVDAANNNCLHLYTNHCLFDEKHIPLIKKIINNTSDINKLLFTENEEGTYAFASLINRLSSEFLIEIIDRTSCLQNSDQTFNTLFDILSKNNSIALLIHLITKHETFNVTSDICWQLIKNHKYFPELIPIMINYSNGIPSDIISMVISSKNTKILEETIPLILTYPEKISHEDLYLFAKYFIQNHQPSKLNNLIHSHHLFNPKDGENIRSHCPFPFEIFIHSIINESAKRKYATVETYDQMFSILKLIRQSLSKSSNPMILFHSSITPSLHNNFTKYLSESKNVDLIKSFIKNFNFKIDTNKNRIHLILSALNNNLIDEATSLLEFLGDFDKDQSASPIIYILSLIQKTHAEFIFPFLKKISSLNYSLSIYDLQGLFASNTNHITNYIKDNFKNININLDDKITSLSKNCQIPELEFIAWLISNFQYNIQYSDADFLLKKSLECYNSPESKATDTIIKYLVQNTSIPLSYPLLKIMIEKRHNEHLHYLTKGKYLPHRIMNPSSKDIIHFEDKTYFGLLYYLKNDQFDLFANLTLYMQFTQLAKKNLISYLSTVLSGKTFYENIFLSEQLLKTLIYPLNHSTIADIFYLIKDNIHFITFLVQESCAHFHLPPPKIKQFVYDCMNSRYKFILPFILHNKKISDTDYEDFIEFIKTQIKEHTIENNMTFLLNYLMFNNNGAHIKPEDQLNLLDLLIEKNIDYRSLYDNFVHYFSLKPPYQVEFFTRIAKYHRTHELKLTFHSLWDPQGMVNKVYDSKENIRNKTLQLLLKNIEGENSKEDIIQLFLEKATHNKDTYLTALLLEYSLTFKKIPFALLQSSILMCASESKLAPKIVDFLSLISPEDQKGSNIKKMTSDLISASIKQTNTSFAVMSIITKIDKSDEFNFIKDPRRHSTMQSPSWKGIPISNTWKTILELAKNKLIELAKQELIETESFVNEIQEFLKTPINSFLFNIFSYNATTQAEQLVAAFQQTLKEKPVTEEEDEMIYMLP